MKLGHCNASTDVAGWRVGLMCFRTVTGVTIDIPTSVGRRTGIVGALWDGHRLNPKWSLRGCADLPPTENRSEGYDAARKRRVDRLSWRDHYSTHGWFGLAPSGVSLRVPICLPARGHNLQWEDESERYEPIGPSATIVTIESPRVGDVVAAIADPAQRWRLVACGSRLAGPVHRSAA